MNHYELLCIISGKMAETEISGFEKTIESMLKNIVSIIHFTHHLDRKKLTYPIDHHTYGYYFLTEFDAEPQAISRIERELTLMNDVIRHAMTQKKTVGVAPTVERKQSFDALPSLAEMPIETVEAKTPVAPVLTDPIPATPVIETPMTTPPPTPVVAAPIEAKPEAVKVKESSKEKEKEEESEGESGQQKKKQVKLSYEELDKRLDEIINNDIF